MKVSLILSFIILALFSCSQPTEEADASGTYVTHFKNEYSITDDTLIITRINSSDLAYSIERKSGFNKIRNGIIQNKEVKVNKWNASYDSNTKALQQTDLGKQIYIVDGNSVKLGDSKYNKVK